MKRESERKKLRGMKSESERKKEGKKERKKDVKKERLKERERKKVQIENSDHILRKSQFCNKKLGFFFPIRQNWVLRQNYEF